jgi:hypothetical protein
VLVHAIVVAGDGTRANVDALPTVASPT